MNPFLPLAGAHVFSVSATFLLPRSIFRPITVALVVVCCAISLNSIDLDTWWGTYLAEYVCGFAMYVNYFLCLRKLVVRSNSSSTWLKVKDQCVMLFNSRCEIPAKELPSFSTEDSEYVPARGSFLLTRCWTFAWTTSTLAILHNYSLNIELDDFESPKNRILRRLPDVSAREWVILFYISTATWLMPYCLFTAAHSLASIIAVAFGDAPMNWRPLFGDIREAYTVQRFFGIFWHKLMRKAFTGHASFLVHDVLGMPRRALESRAAIIMTSFLISGCMHSMVIPLPVSCAGPRIILYYGGIGGIVVLENIIQTLFRRYSMIWNKTGVVSNKLNWQVLGYLWVVFFHLWTTAKTTYPLAFCDLALSTSYSAD